MENRIKGYINIGVSTLLFIYYTLWVIGLPFVDDEHAKLVNKFFPPVEFALGIPCLIFVSIFLVLLAQAYKLVCRDRKLNNKSM